MARIEIRLFATKPWWFNLAIAGATAWAWLRLPFDMDRFARWLASHFKVGIE